MDMTGVNAKVAAMLPPLPGWCPTDKGQRMARLVIESAAKLSVEIGVFGGRSLAALALGHEHLGAGKAIGIDPYEKSASLEGSHDKVNSDWWGVLNHEEIYHAAKAGIVRYGLTAFAEIRRVRAEEIVHLFDDGEVDVIHLDGNHSEEASTRDVRLWLPKVRPGGYWVFDDIGWTTGGKVSTKRAQEMLLESGCSLFENHGTWAIFQKAAS